MDTSGHDREGAVCVINSPSASSLFHLSSIVCHSSFSRTLAPSYVSVGIHLCLHLCVNGPADTARFSQLQRILYVLSVPETPDQHPSACLIQLEDVSREIRSRP